MSEENISPTIGDVAQGVKPTPSVADLLRQGYERAQQQRKPKDIQLYGYGEPDSELHVTFRALDDYEEVRDRLRENIAQRGLKPAQLEVAAALETLSMAAEGSYALVNGERVDIGLPLGLELYGYLFGDSQGPQPRKDSEAIVLLFHGKTLPIMTVYHEFDLWNRHGGQEAEEAALGE